MGISMKRLRIYIAMFVSRYSVPLILAVKINEGFEGFFRGWRKKEFQ
jgi:hypothetical protein